MSGRLSALIAAGCLIAAGAARTDAAGWTVAASPHFEVYTTAGANAAGEALAYFEDVRDFFEAFLSLPSTSRPATQVFIFSNEFEFAPYRGTASASAYYQPGRDRDYIVLRDFNSDARPMIVHEYAHLALQRGGAVYPTWLSEGLAEFFSTMVPDRRRMLLGRAPLGRLVTLKTEAMLPVVRLLAVDRDSPEYTSSHAGVFYAESWALTHMLVAGERYQPRVDAFLAAVTQGTPVPEALARVYRKSVPDIDRDLRAYVARGFFRQLSAAHDRRAQASRTTGAPADPFVVDLSLANVLAAGIGREARARAAFERLASVRPRDADLATSRGLFELQSGHNDVAETWLNLAVTAGTRSAMAHAELARLVEPADPARAAALLSTAVALAPDNTEVRIRVAANFVVRHLATQALAGLARIKPEDIGDQRFMYYQVLANAHAALGDFDVARAAASRVRETARNAEERAFAETLMQQVRGPADITDVVRGRLSAVICGGPAPILEVITDAGVLRLVVDDRAKVVLAGGVGATELPCGAQDIPLRVGFARGGGPAGTHGRVRLLDFR